MSAFLDGLSNVYTKVKNFITGTKVEQPTTTKKQVLLTDLKFPELTTPAKASNNSTTSAVVKNMIPALSGSGIYVIVTASSADILDTPEYTSIGRSFVKAPKGAILEDVTDKARNFTRIYINSVDYRQWMCVLWHNAGKHYQGWINRKFVEPYVKPTALRKSPTASTSKTVTTITPTVVPKATAKEVDKVTYTTTTHKKSTLYNIIDTTVKPADSAEINPTAGVLPMEFKLPESYPSSDNNYKGDRFRMIVYNRDNAGVVHTKIFTMTIGPQAYTQNFNNAVSPIKTGGGYLIARSGQELSSMQLSGVLLDAKDVNERGSFIDAYYNKYIVDQISAFHEYFNNSRLVVELEGYRYFGILTNLSLSKTANSKHLYTYTMNFLVTSMERLSAGEDTK